MTVAGVFSLLGSLQSKPAFSVVIILKAYTITYTMILFSLKFQKSVRGGIS